MALYLLFCHQKRHYRFRSFLVTEALQSFQEYFAPSRGYPIGLLSPQENFYCRRLCFQSIALVGCFHHSPMIHSLSPDVPAEIHHRKTGKTGGKTGTLPIFRNLRPQQISPAGYVPTSTFSHIIQANITDADSCYFHDAFIKYVS